MGNIDIHYVLQNIDDLKPKDIFYTDTFVGFGSRRDEIGVYLSDKVCELFDNLKTWDKLEIVRNLIDYHNPSEFFCFGGTKLQELIGDTLDATEAYFTEKYVEYSNCSYSTTDFCRDFEVNLYLHDYLLNG